MKKNLIILAFVIFIITACGAGSPTPTLDLGAIQTSVINTAWAALNQTTTANAPTSMPQPMETQIPPTAKLESVSGKEFSWNYISEQESGGIKIQIARVLIADKLAIFPDIDFSDSPIFNDKPVVAEIIFKITNSTEKEITVFTNQGTVIVGSEQVQLIDYAIAGNEFGENYSGKIFPGVTVIGGIWFGLKRNQIDDIQNMIIAIDAPIDESSFTQLGPEFRIAVDLSQRKQEPIPDELK